MNYPIKYNIKQLSVAITQIWYTDWPIGATLKLTGNITFNNDAKLFLLENGVLH